MLTCWSRMDFSWSNNLLISLFVGGGGGGGGGGELGIECLPFNLLLVFNLGAIIDCLIHEWTTTLAPCTCTYCIYIGSLPYICVLNNVQASDVTLSVVIDSIC